MAESTEFQALNKATDGANVKLGGMFPAVDDHHIG